MLCIGRGIDSGDRIPAEMRKILDVKWKEMKWKEKAEINTVNRRSSGGPIHTGGSIPTTEHYKRLKKASDISPTCWKLFQTTHRVKGDPNKWVSLKALAVANEYENKIVERDSQEPLGDGVSIHQADDDIFLDVVRGVDKKGRIYGLGTEAEKYKPSRSCTYDGISPSEYQHMKTKIYDLSSENRTLKEKLKTHEELIHRSQEDSRLLREQLFQFMAKFSSIHLPPHSVSPSPPPPTTT